MTKKETNTTNKYYKTVLNNYFPDSQSEEKVALLDIACNTGCGYTAFTNFIFKSFEGNESGFADTFGFPMYNVKYDSGTFSIDYNYEPVIMDLYCNSNSKSGEYNIKDT